jgi:hypothetical protein
MSAVKLTGQSYYLTFTPHEFMLVTKGLIGTLEEEPIERIIGGKPTLVDEEKDAQTLAFRLMEQRKKTYRALLKKAEVAIENAWEAVKEEVV